MTYETLGIEYHGHEKLISIPGGSKLQTTGLCTVIRPGDLFAHQGGDNSWNETCIADDDCFAKGEINQIVKTRPLRFIG